MIGVIFPVRKGIIIILALTIGGIIFGKSFFGNKPMVSGYNNENANRTIHILAGIDSLTNGRLYSADKSRYLDDFIPKLKNAYGDGGPGYIPFDTRFFNQEGGTLTFSNGLKEINNLPHNIYPAPFSFDFKGIYTNFGRSYTITVRLKNAWRYGKIFYLKQTGGGTFDVGFLNGKKQRIDTDGKKGLGIVELPPNKKGLPLVINNIQGKVVLFGGYFYNPAGIIISRVGQGGDRLAWYSQLDQRQLKEWIKALKPELFIFNGGMNDLEFLNANLYEQALNKYLIPFQESNCPLILTIPNAINGNQTRLNAYEAKLRAFSKRRQTGLISNKVVLGKTYRDANAKGYMADSIHPNEKGYKLISLNLLSYINSHAEYHKIFLKNK